jgi:hypothetical protein
VKRPSYTRSNRLASIIFAVTGCVLLVWSFARAQTPTTKPVVRYQRVLSCVPGDCDAELRKLNEEGYHVTPSSTCDPVGGKWVCVLDKDDEADESGAGK